jgi:hypothetical protein
MVVGWRVPVEPDFFVFLQNLDVVAEACVGGSVVRVPRGEPLYLCLGLVDAYLAEVYLVYFGEVFLEAFQRIVFEFYV